MKQARLCTFCKHPYIEPCDGKNPDCQNKLSKEGKLKPLLAAKKEKHK